jgi:hypothetical protein
MGRKPSCRSDRAEDAGRHRHHRRPHLYRRTAGLCCGALRPVDRAPANFITADEGQTRLRASYGEDKYRPLVTLKDSCDLGNVFARNPNITPRRHGPRTDMADVMGLAKIVQSRRDQVACGVGTRASGLG